MKDVVIRLENLGKRYRLAHQRQHVGTLRDSIMDGVRDATRWLKPRPESSSSAGCNGATVAAREDFWALKDVSFDVPRGQVLGLIGRNGAGKSTILKLLSRITEPTTGRIGLRGRVASLLEVGTGFHPELTGRENIFLNGAIMGMKRAEIRRKFDEIVAFAEIEKFLDTPVKRYSSGMYVRLGFAVAAHLDPEILIVDEVLAVGDLAFQKKCVGKMNAVAKQDRTVIFVSHNMSTVQALCSRGIVLEQGKVVLDASAQQATNHYIRSNRGTFDIGDDSLHNRMRRTSGAVRFTSIHLEDEHGVERSSFQEGETVRIVLNCKAYQTVPDLGILLQINSGTTNDYVTSVKAPLCESELQAGAELTVKLTLPSIQLRPADYSLYVCLGNKCTDRFYDVIDRNVSLPSLSITSEETDLHKLLGCFSIPWDLAVDRKC
jgi:lipopolysaccharide transport system ATP-binding protein